MLRKDYFAKILVVFGIATLIASLVDIIVLLVPLQLKFPQWVYYTVQGVSELSLVPIIGVLAIVGGLYLGKSANSKLTIFAERFLAVLCSVFSLGLIVSIVFYTISMNSIENKALAGIKKEAASIKIQVNEYAKKNPQITEERLATKIAEIDTQLLKRTKKTTNDLAKKNIKTMTNLIAYAFVYVLAAILLLKVSLLEAKRMYYNKPEEETTGQQQ